MIREDVLTYVKKECDIEPDYPFGKFWFKAIVTKIKIH